MNKKTKILVVSQHFWPEVFRIADICEGLVERGYEVDVLCGIPSYPAENFIKVMA
jgi:colanic acid biosynthesis glycosyl transferase WcaI